MNKIQLVIQLGRCFKKDYYQSSLGYDIVDWFINEVLKLENKIVSFLETLKRISL